MNNAEISMIVSLAAFGVVWFAYSCRYRTQMAEALKEPEGTIKKVRKQWYISIRCTDGGLKMYYDTKEEAETELRNLVNLINQGQHAAYITSPTTPGMVNLDKVIDALVRYQETEVEG